MVFVHDSPATINFPKADGQSKVQGCPLHFLRWLHALHMRKREGYIITCNNFQPSDIECNRVGLVGIKQPPGVFVSRQSPAT